MTPREQAAFAAGIQAAVSIEVRDDAERFASRPRPHADRREGLHSDPGVAFIDKPPATALELAGTAAVDPSDWICSNSKQDGSTTG